MFQAPFHSVKSCIIKATMEPLLEFLSQHFGWVQNPVVIARQALAGIANGMLLFLISSGLTLIFGVSRIVNFAHGVLFMLGAYVALTIIRLGPDHLGWFAAALVVATVGLLAFGAITEITLLRPIYKAAEEYQLLLTFGLVFIMGDVVKLVWGREDHAVTVPELLSGSVDALGVTFPTYRMFLIFFGAAMAVALWLLLHRTRWGILVRAATMDRHILSALGTNTKALFTGVFALGTALAGLGGALAAPLVAVNPGLHVQVIIDAFVVVVIGGMGSVVGALVASLLVGIVNAFGVLAFPATAVVLTFALMALVLIVRPWGLFGRPD